MGGDGSSLGIVVPTLGREDVLVETLRQLLALDPAPNELLVIDQTPRHTAETEAFLISAHDAGQLRWVRLESPGTVGALNRGLVEARTELVLFLDDDILPSATLVAAHRTVFQSDDRVWAVVGQVLQPENGFCPSSDGPSASRRGLVRNLDFAFNGTRPMQVSNVMAGNLSVRRDRALAVGGFDEQFLPPVSYRFETEFARRLIAAGGVVQFEPSASIRHLRAARGGTRTLGSHLKSLSPLHGVGDYYFALRCGRGWERMRYLVQRPFREIRTRYHLVHPWWIPIKFIGELRALALAIRLFREGPRLLLRVTPEVAT